MALPAWWLIGWRNLGRNPRRTFITAMGLAAGYFAVIFMVGFADGLKVELIDNGTSLMTGQIQIHAPGYRPDRSLYETLGGRDGTDFEWLIRRAARDTAVVAAAPRVYAGGLLSSGQATSAGMFMGIDPEREPRVSRLMSALMQGREPAQGSHEVLIGTEMARQLDVEVGDDVILVAPAADGSMGNDIFGVCGLFQTGMADLDGSFVLMPIQSLQRLVALDPGRIHEIAVSTTDPWLAPEAGQRLVSSLASLGVEMEVLPWTRLRPEMLEYAMLMDSWYSIVVVIVFAIALFGVANTMLMATFERRREFSVMLALGTRAPSDSAHGRLGGDGAGMDQLGAGRGHHFPTRRLVAPRAARSELDLWGFHHAWSPDTSRAQDRV